MAAVIELGQLSSLLNQARENGCVLAWLDGGRLVAGPRLGHATHNVDFGSERLTELRCEKNANARERDLSVAVEGAGQRALLSVEGGSSGVIEGSNTLGRRTGNFQLILEERTYHATSQRRLLLTALTEIERLRPGTLDKLTGEKGRTKRPVARQKEQLYGDPKLSKHAEQIGGGWWVATNNSFPEVEKYIRRAAFHAGLHVDLRRAP